MAPAQYEQHLRGRSDFIKGTKKDPSAQKKVSRGRCGAWPEEGLWGQRHPPFSFPLRPPSDSARSSQLFNPYLTLRILNVEFWPVSGCFYFNFCFKSVQPVSASNLLAVVQFCPAVPCRCPPAPLSVCLCPHPLVSPPESFPSRESLQMGGQTEEVKKCLLNSLPWSFQTEIIRKRLHKDIPHHPVIMLNFCPDLKALQPNLRKTHGEFIFLVDRSRSMAGTSIARVKVGCAPSLPGLPSLSLEAACAKILR